MPDPDQTTSLAKFIAITMDAVGVLDHELARHLGCSTAVVQMILAGQVKMPIELVPDTADILAIDRLELLERALDEHLPNVMKALVRCAIGLTDNEMAIVQFIREVSERSDPSLAEPGVAEGLQAAFARATPDSGPR